MGKKLFRRSAALVLMLMVLSTGLVVNAEGSYTVEKGDYLKKIAQSVYGDSARWEDIYEANKAAIKDPNIIYKGQVLILPDAVPVPAENPETETPETEIPVEGAPVEEVPSNTAMTLEQWTLSEECQTAIQWANELMKDFGMVASLKADGNMLVYEYTFSAEVWGDMTTAEMTAALETSDFEAFLSSQSGMVEGLRQEFDASYGIKLEGVRYVYIAPDGGVVYSTELKN